MTELAHSPLVPTIEQLPAYYDRDEYRLALDGLCGRVGPWLDRSEAADPSVYGSETALGSRRLSVIQFQMAAHGDTAHFLHGPVINLRRTPHSANGGNVSQYAMDYDSSTAHPLYLQEEQDQGNHIRYSWAVEADGSLERPLFRIITPLDPESQYDQPEAGERHRSGIDVPTPDVLDKIFRLDDLLARVASQEVVDTLDIRALRARGAMMTPLISKLLGPSEVFPTVDGIGFSRRFSR